MLRLVTIRRPIISNPHRAPPLQLRCLLLNRFRNHLYHHTIGIHHMSNMRIQRLRHTLRFPPIIFRMILRGLILLRSDDGILSLSLQPILNIRSNTIIYHLHFRRRRAILTYLTSSTIRMLLRLNRAVIHRTTTLRRGRRQNITSIRRVIVIRTLHSPNSVCNGSKTGPPSLTMYNNPSNRLSCFINTTLRLRLNSMLSTHQIRSSQISRLLMMSHLTISNLLVLTRLPRTILNIIPIRVHRLSTQIRPPTLFRTKNILSRLRLCSIPIRIPSSLYMNTTMNFPNLRSILGRLITLLLRIRRLSSLHHPIPLYFRLQNFIHIYGIIFMPSISTRSNGIKLMNPSTLQRCNTFIRRLKGPSRIGQQLYPGAYHMHLLQQSLRKTIYFNSKLRPTTLLQIIHFGSTSICPLLNKLLLITRFLASPLLLNLANERDEEVRSTSSNRYVPHFFVTSLLSAQVLTSSIVRCFHIRD